MAAAAELMSTATDSRPQLLGEVEVRPVEVEVEVEAGDKSDATQKHEASPRSLTSTSPQGRDSHIVSFVVHKAQSTPEKPQQQQQQPESLDNPQELVSSTDGTRPDNMSADTDGNQKGVRPSLEARLPRLEELDDDDDEGALTPPPDSPSDEDDGTAGNPGGLLKGQNESAGGPGLNLSRRPAQSAPSDQEDAEMEDAEEDDATLPVALSSATVYPKRKRTSIYENFAEDRLGNQSADPNDDGGVELELRQRVPKTSKAPSGVKGVVLGIWRDSGVPNMKQKHSVIGFIDVRDRLRTRIQPCDRDGNSLTGLYPLPPGPGGSWVTFDKVAFEPHLIGLNHFQIKEYVKIRADTAGPEEVAQEKQAHDQAAVAEAVERVEKMPSAETSVSPAIAYGPELPDNVQLPTRPEKKRRLMSSGVGNSPAAPAPANVLENIPGTRPTRVLVGVWKESSEDQRERKHAVYGILGANDMFRVKLVRETRDGTHVIGNFPNGAGALWIHWDEVDFDPHLSALTRPEVKEYCRVRQRQLDEGESPAQRTANESQAVHQAQQRVRQMTSGTNANVAPSAIKRRESELAQVATSTELPLPNQYQQQQPRPQLPSAGGTPGHQANMPDGLPSQPHLRSSEAALRQQKKNAANDGGMTSRAFNNISEGGSGTTHRPPRHSLPNMDLDRANSIARREVQKVEQAQIRADQRAASREAAAAAMVGVGGPGQQRLPGLPSIGAISGPDGNGNIDNKTLFQDNVSRLNKVWAAQEANRLRNGAEDAKISNGIKYERKLMGPFSGKLVSQGTILNIDGEDYVEYRVLTKPSFF